MMETLSHYTTPKDVREIAKRAMQLEGVPFVFEVAKSVDAHVGQYINEITRAVLNEVRRMKQEGER